MKKITTISISIAIILFLGGIVMSFCAFSLVDFNITELGTQGTYEKKEMRITDFSQIKKISFNDYNKGFNIKKSDTNEIVLSYYESEKETYEFTDENGVLSVSLKNNKKWYEYIGVNFDFSDKSIFLEVPENFNFDLYVKTSNGKITIKDINTINNIDLKTSNGTIDVDNVESTGNISLISSNGKIRVNQLKSENKINFSTYNGLIDMKNVSCNEIIAETSNGKISSENLFSKQSIYLNTSNGNIELNKIDSNNIKISTSNSSINGIIQGSREDYTVYSKTSNGNNNLNDGGNGSKILDLKTSNGRININFEK